MIASVQRRRTFAGFRTDGQRVRHGSVRLNHLPLERLEPGATSPQLAFAIGRPFGGAVERNRGRRRLRAAFVEAWEDLGGDRVDELAGAYLMSGSRHVLVAPFGQLVADVRVCFETLARRAANASTTRR